MEEKEVQSEEITAEYALIDVLDHIFQYFQMRDLLNASLVCKSWHSAASRAMLNRGPECALLPTIESEEIMDPKFHVYDYINARPHIALLFVSPSLRERETADLEKKISDAYKRYFPQYLVTIGVDECIMDEDTIVSCPGLEESVSGVLGLFIPAYKDITIRVAMLPFIELSAVTEGNNEGKTAIIMFCSTHDAKNIANNVLKIIKERFPQKKYTLWGGMFDDDLKAINCKSNNQENNQPTKLFILSLSGASINSWSIVLDCRLTRIEFDTKLLNFRDRLRLRRYSIGLVCGPRYIEDSSGKIPNSCGPDVSKALYRTSQELMVTVKDIFPNIPLIGVFNYGHHSHFGVDSFSDDANQPLQYEMAMSLMIISYY